MAGTPTVQTLKGTCEKWCIDSKTPQPPQRHRQRAENKHSQLQIAFTMKSMVYASPQNRCRRTIEAPSFGSLIDSAALDTCSIDRDCLMLKKIAPNCSFSFLSKVLAKHLPAETNPNNLQECLLVGAINWLAAAL